MSPSNSEFPTMWLVLGDKGYQAAQKFVRLLHPKKKPTGGSLTADEIENNR